MLLNYILLLLLLLYPLEKTKSNALTRYRCGGVGVPSVKCILHSRTAPTINPLAVSTPRHLMCTWYRDVHVGVNAFKISLSNSLNVFLEHTTVERETKGNDYGLKLYEMRISIDFRH